MPTSLLNELTSQRNPNGLISENYNLTLAQSMQSVVAEIKKETPNFTHFVDIFYELMQAKIDPPLETIWVYVALSFRRLNFTDEDPLNQLSVVKDLFQLISACSGSCGSSKSIALLAPVAFQVYKVAVELKGRDLGSKRDKKVIRELKSLIDAILGFVIVCYCKNLNGQSDVISDNDLNPIVPVKYLFSLWMDKNGNLESFLPLVNADVFRGICERECDVNHLAGVVVVEVFLLKFCLNFMVGDAGKELEKELTSWVVSSMTKIQNVYFFETLLKMLLEPSFLFTSILSSNDEVLLRKVLYDAVILVEYSFLNPKRAAHLPDERIKSLSLTRLIAMQEAIEFSREDGDQKRAISYASAFSSSKLPSQIIKWIASQIGMDEKASISIGSSPKALLRWLLSLENQGIRVFGDRILKSRAKLAVDNSKADYEHQSSKIEGKKANDNLLFYIDNKGEEEESEGEENKEINESMNAAFVAAAHSMKMTEDSGRKRKERGSSGKKKKIKYHKFDLSNTSDSTKERFSSVSNKGSSSESDIAEPLSDEDV
ncbi:hypothetical protein KPL70_000952 [Citrus sinensis]|uniref:Uncharacterized protein n=2 Tax=Citrus TaxID=2706 RepID=V4UQD8_CITCL|nr:uncharacterized protein LOC18055618 [Citrus x clementina]XP_006475403.1 uncharacterized protein LOC102620155 [Citrus sinensis]ESR64656.1 hypothetical protein CICLE_v10007935mg [Citrus x clementina]KAH9762842.1 hypothetical protein KPL70_000952 [Citrus sinensis]GAY50454.1 hypothetical protein CUMW_126780 [Citrus unshiu]